MIPYAIHEFGARPHQRGYGGDGDGRRWVWPIASRQESGPDGPVIEHVRNGKPLTEVGKALLKQKTKQ